MQKGSPNLYRITRLLPVFAFLLPVLLTAEASPNNVYANIEKSREVLRDSIGPSVSNEPGVALPDIIEPAPLAPDNNPGAKKEEYDYRKDGLFKGLFHVGLNAAQIDGDAYAGYNYFGFDGGIGTMFRFHKYFSTSVEINYTMWGAKEALVEPSYNLYRTRLDYVQVPLSINIHDKEIIMFSAGVNLGFLVNYNERNEKGVDITDTIQPQPKKFDLDAFAALHFIIKKQFAIGLKFSYSMIPFRGIESTYVNLTRIQGEYNNVVTLRFMYILSAWKKK